MSNGSEAVATTVVALQGRPIAATQPAANQVLQFTGSQWAPTTLTAGTGTVSSVAAGNGLTATPSPIVTTGTMSLSVPVSIANGGTNATTASAALANLGGISGNQTITLSGDIAGSGATAITTTLANSGVTAGTYNNVTVNAKGLATAGSNVAYLTSAVTSITAGAGLTGGTITGTGTIALASPIAASFMPAFTGDMTSPAGSTVNTLPTVNANVGTWNNVTINAKGLATAGSNVAYLTTAVTSLTAGTGITLTPATITGTGTIALTAPVTVANGGTGAATLTGYVQGNGTGAMTASATIPNTSITGLGTISTQNANAVAITGGTVNGTSIGASTTSTGAFTILSASGAATFTNSLTGSPANQSVTFSPTGTGSVTINPATLGHIDNTAIGATTASTGAFTTLSASSTVSGAGFTTLLAPYAPLASPTFTGTPSLPTGTTGVTQTAGNSSTALATTAFVATATGAYLPLAGGTLTGAVTATGAAGQITLNNATSNWISFSAAGLGAPAFTTRSAGTKLVLYNSVGAASADYAIGVNTNVFWQSVNTTTSSFQWYGGTTVAGTLTGTGALTLAGNLTCNSNANPTLQAGVASNYTGLYAPDGTGTGAGIYVGNLSAGNIAHHSQGTHVFQDAGGATTFATFASGGTTIGSPTGGAKGAGTLNATTVYAGGVALTSDARVKRDIDPLPDDCLELVGSIEPKQFRFIEPPQPEPTGLWDGQTRRHVEMGPPGWFERKHWGFLAQDVQAAMAGYEFGGVEEDASGNLSLSPSDMVAVLWKAVQELTGRVATIEGS